MTRFTSSAVTVLLLIGLARADLILETDAPVGTPLAVFPGTTSGPMLMRTFENGTPNLPTDQLTGWQATLTIVPFGTTTGSVTINTATIPSVNYVFTTNLSISTTFSAGNTQLLAFSNGTFEAVTVPGPPGSNLLQMDFNASGDASGTFRVVALDGPFQTEWNDNDNIVMSRTFENLPGTGAGVAIGEINVVPEPSAFLCVLIPLASLAVFKWCRRKE